MLITEGSLSIFINDSNFSGARIDGGTCLTIYNRSGYSSICDCPCNYASNAFEKIREYINSKYLYNKNTVVINTDDSSYALPIDDIIYIANDKNRITIDYGYQYLLRGYIGNDRYKNAFLYTMFQYFCKKGEPCDHLLKEITETVDVNSDDYQDLLKLMEMYVNRDNSND